MSPANLEEQVDTNKPPIQRKKARRPIRAGAAGHTGPSSAILAGVEDDVVDWNDEEDTSKQAADARNSENPDASDLSQRDLINKPPAFESVPTDKFYLEMEKKFAIQNKNLFEKKQEERIRQLQEAEKKRMLREELKFQISTPRTALKTHKFIKALFLLIQGINIGFLIWQSVLVYTVNINSFTLNLNTSVIAQPEQLPYFYVFRDLALPIHCLSYFFLTICIVDCMDR